LRLLLFLCFQLVALILLLLVVCLGDFMSSTREKIMQSDLPDAAPIKLPIGRPSSYKPELCQRVVELGAEGWSQTEIAAEFGIDKKSLYDWAGKHPDFSTALSRAKALEQSWWEKRGRASLDAKNFQSSVWSKSMTARFKDDYTERRELTGANGGAIQVETKALSVDDFDPDDLASLEFLVQKAIAKSDTGSDE
jgi:hypothetical protein